MHACQAKSAIFFLAQRVKVQKLIIPHVGQRAYKRGNGTDVFHRIGNAWDERCTHYRRYAAVGESLRVFQHRSIGDARNLTVLGSSISLMSKNT